MKLSLWQQAKELHRLELLYRTLAHECQRASDFHLFQNKKDSEIWYGWYEDKEIAYYIKANEYYLARKRLGEQNG